VEPKELRDHLAARVSRDQQVKPELLVMQEASERQDWSELPELLVEQDLQDLVEMLVPLERLALMDKLDHLEQLEPAVRRVLKASKVQPDQLAARE
jgi:hypothetical protein